MYRGSNQSSDTKYATQLVCEAVALLKSGRADNAREHLNRALSLLPSIDNPIQEAAEKEDQATRVRFYA